MTMSRQELLRAGALLITAVLVGWIAGALGWALFVAALIWIVGQQRQRAQLIRWSERPLGRPTNETEPWQFLAYRFYRAIGRARGRHRNTLAKFKTLRAITDALPDAAVIVDATGNIENLNIAAQEMLRVSPGDVGYQLSSLVRQPEL